MTQLRSTGTNCEPLKSCAAKPFPDRRVHVVLELAGFTWSEVESKLGTGFIYTSVLIVWMRQRLVCTAPAPKNTFDAKNGCGIGLSEAQGTNNGVAARNGVVEGAPPVGRESSPKRASLLPLLSL